MNIAIWNVLETPSRLDLESRKVLKALPAVHSALAALKGIALEIGKE